MIEDDFDATLFKGYKRDFKQRFTEQKDYVIIKEKRNEQIFINLNTVRIMLSGKSKNKSLYFRKYFIMMEYFALKTLEEEFNTI